MNRSSRTNTVAIFTLLIAPLAAIAAGKQAPGEGNPRDLVFSLSVAKSTFVQYEPVPVRYAVWNPTNKRIRAQVNMNFAAQETRPFINREGGKPTEYFAGGVDCSGSVPGGGATLGPGQKIEREVVLFRNQLKGELAFPALGRYELSGRVPVGYDAGGGALFAEAAPIGIEIVAPGDIDLRFAARLGSTDRLIDLLERGAARACDKEPQVPCLADLRQALEHFMDSAYAPQVMFDLAATLSWTGTQFADYRQAGELFEEFLKRWPADFRGPDAMRFGAAAWTRAGRPDIAVEWADRFAKKYPARTKELKEIQESLGSFRPQPQEQPQGTPPYPY